MNALRVRLSESSAIQLLALGGRQHPMSIELTRVGPNEHRARAMQHASLSLLVPGLGQLAQHRFGAAVIQFGTVAAYVGGAVGLAGHKAVLLAVAWNLWSIVDAYRQEPSS